MTIEIYGNSVKKLRESAASSGTLESRILASLENGSKNKIGLDELVRIEPKNKIAMYQCIVGRVEFDLKPSEVV